MQHPFIGDLSDKKLEELQTILQGLYSKLNFAQRMQNPAMIQQLQMVIESYQTECNRRLDEIYKKQNIDNRINVTKTK